MSDVLFVVTDVRRLGFRQSTVDLVVRLAERHGVWVAGEQSFAVTPRGVTVQAHRWPARGSRKQALSRVRRAENPEERVVIDFDGVWVRANPGRSGRPSLVWLQLLAHVEDRGLVVRNQTSGLIRAVSKLHLASLPPDTIPRTWSSDDPQRLASFLDRLGGPAVLKPAVGTKGHGVVRLDPDTPDRDGILARATEHGPALLQDYLPEAASGDIRVHVVGGRLFEVDGQECVVRRVPAEGEWRSNVSLGGQPRPASLTEEQRELVDRVGPILADQGLWHVGLDLVGDRIVEVNVFSPGGVADAAEFYGVDFVGALGRAFEQEL